MLSRATFPGCRLFAYLYCQLRPYMLHSFAAARENIEAYSNTLYPVNFTRTPKRISVLCGLSIQPLL